MEDELLAEGKKRIWKVPVYQEKPFTEDIFNSLDSLETDFQSISTRIKELKRSLKRLQRKKNRLFTTRTWRMGKALDKVLFRLALRKFTNKPAKGLEEQVNKVQNEIRELDKSADFSKIVRQLKSDITLKQFNKQVINPEDIFVESAEILTFKQSSSPKVSIIIPVYKNAQYTYFCLKSILENTSKRIAFEIIVVDDCSPDASYSLLREKTKNVRFIKNKENQGFLRSCNIGASHSSGQYLVFLNNDTSVQDRWLKNLLRTFELFPNTGLTGSKLIYPDGTLQEAGGIIWNDASGWNFGRLQNPQSQEYAYSKEVDYISGASIMIKENLWKEIGGFDERYVPAYYEDTDLAFEVRRRGYKVMFQPWSEVIHYEGKSNGTDIDSGIKSYQKINKLKFVEKWKSELKKQHANAQNQFLARDRSTPEKTILFIDHHVPQFDQDAGSRSVLSYLKLFVNKGYNVKFLGNNYHYTRPYTDVIEQLGIEVLYGSWYRTNLEDWLRDKGKYIHNVFMNRPHIAPKYIDLLRKHTNAHLLYYGHDLHFVRNERKRELGIAINEPKSPEQIKKEELELIDRVDVALYPSRVEVDILKSIDKSIRTDQIPVYLFDGFDPPKPRNATTHDIMFLGGFAHPPNVDGILWFVKESWPIVKNKFEHAKLFIIGNAPPKEILELESADIRVTGHVSTQTLSKFYSEIRLAIAPLRYGAGIKGKVVEALYHQVPLVTTSIGAEGLDEATDHMIVRDDPKEFAEAVMDLYRDQELGKRYSNRGKAYCEKYFSNDRAWSSISKYLKV